MKKSLLFFLMFLFVNMTFAQQFDVFQTSIDADAIIQKALDAKSSSKSVLSENFDGVVAPAFPVGWTTENTNNDTEEWTVVDAGANSPDNCVKIEYNGSLAMDDWLFSPSVSLETGKDYKLTFYYKCQSSTYSEQLEVKYGTTATSAGMTTSIVDLGSFNNTDYLMSQTVFNVTTTGSYYIGIHGYSLANMYNIYIDDVSVFEVLADDFEVVLDSTETYINQKDVQLTAYANVRNNGSTTQSKTVTFKANGDVIGTATTSSLVGETSEDVTINWTPTVVGRYTITAEVVSDENDANNSAECSIDVVEATQFAQDFEGDFLPIGWEQTSDGWIKGSYYTYLVSDAYSAFCSQQAGDPEEMLVTRPFVLDGSITQLSYWTRGLNNEGGYGSSTLQLKYRTYPLGDWTNLGTAIDYAVTGDEKHIVDVDLTSLTNGNYQLGFATTSTFSYSYFNSGVAIDDVFGPDFLELFNITFTVTDDAGTPVPLANATITIKSGTDEIFILTTDATGVANQYIGAGNYTYDVERIGYITQSDQVLNVSADAPVSVQMTEAPPQFAITPDTWDYGTVSIFRSLEKEYTIQNTGSGTMTINPSDITITGADASDFELVNISSTAELTLGQTAVFSVNFAPAAAGVKAAQISIEDNITKTVNTVDINGLGADPTVTTFPWTEDFEGEWTGNPETPFGWEHITVSGTNVWEKSESEHTGTYSAKAPWASAGGEHLLITPPLDFTNKDYRLKFWLDGSTSAGTDLKVQIGTSMSSATDFSTDLAYYIAGTDMPGSWTEVVIDLSAYEGVQFIAFRMIDANGYSLYIDDVSVSEILPIPPEPVAIEFPLDDLTTFVNPKLEWTPSLTGEPATGYKVYLNTTNTFTETEKVYEGTDLFFQTADLAAGTEYFWKVVPFNGNGDQTVGIQTWSFTTASEGQLAENFENDFPPIGWSNPGFWSSSAFTYFSGAKSVYKYNSTDEKLLTTPLVEVGATSTLEFFARTTSTNDGQKLQIQYSANGTDWTDVGTLIEFTASQDWTHYIVDLSSITAGNYYLGFSSYYEGALVGDTYVDHVIGPDIVPIAPNAVTLNSPSADATNVGILPSLSWTAASDGGIPTGFKIYLGTSEADVTNEVPSALYTTTANSPYQITTELEYSTTYAWKVVATNAVDDASDSPYRKFTTMDDPTIDIPYEQNFDASTSVPDELDADGFSIKTGGGVDGTNALYDNIWQNVIYDIITVPLAGIETGTIFNFDYKLSNYAGTTGTDISSTNDKVEIFVSDDNGSTWNLEHTINSSNHTTSADYANVIVDLSSYNGGTIKIKVLATWDNVADLDYYLFFDNFKVYTPVPNDAGITAITSPVTGVTGNQDIVVTLKNFGLTTMTACNIDYTINTVAGTTYNWTGTLASGETTNVTIETAHNFATEGEYTIVATAVLANDENTNNDEFTSTVTLFAPNTLPYFEGFETGHTDQTALGNNLTQESIAGAEVWTANNTATTNNREPRTGDWNAYLRYGNTDWFFIPVTLNAGVEHTFTMYARQNAATTTNASVAVSYGTANNAAAMTNEIVASTGLTNGDYQEITGTFTPSTKGTYFIGVNGTLNSALELWYVSIDDISIEAGANPAFPVTFSVVGTPANGTLAATVDAAAITSGDEVEAGKDVIFTAAPETGYRVKEWKLNDVVIADLTETTYTHTIVDAAVDVKVEFELTPVTHTVTFSAGDNGAIAAMLGDVELTSPATVDEGSNIVFTATPDAGYKVEKWILDGVDVADNETNTYTLENVSADAVVTVQFVEKEAVTITLADLEQTYDALAKVVTATTEPADLDVTIVYSQGTGAEYVVVDEPTLPGTYDVVATVDTETQYGTATEQLVILPAPITLTANDVYKKEGLVYNFDIDIDVTIDGEFFGTDELTGLTFVCDGAEATATLGDYDIVISDAIGTGLDNYEITYVNGTMTVTDKFVLTIDGLTASDKVYDGTRAATITDFGTLAGIETGLEDVALVTTEAVAQFGNKNVGVDKTVTVTGITLSGTDAGEYIINTPTTLADITPAALTITLDDAVKQYGDPEPEYTYTCEGFVNEETDAVLTGELIVTREDNEAIGTYVTTPLGLEAMNYEITFVDGELEIIAKELTIAGTFTVENKVYDGTTAATIVDNQLTLVGIVGEEDVALDNVVAEFESADIANDIVVSIVSADLVGADIDNYTLSFVDAPTTTANIVNDMILPEAGVLTFKTTDIETPVLINPVENAYDLGDISGCGLLEYLLIAVEDDNLDETETFPVYYETEEFGYMAYSAELSAWAFVPTVTPFNWSEGLNTLTTTFIDDDLNELEIDVNFNYVSCTIATLSDLLVDDVTVEGFDAEIFIYDVVLPSGTIEIPVVSSVLTNQFATEVTTQATELPGAATVVVTAQDEITSNTYTINFTIDVAVNELVNSDISIYPNPSEGLYKVTLDGDYLIKVYDITGKVILTKDVNNIENTIDLTSQNAGIYFVNFIGKHNVTIKLIKK